MLVWYFYRRGQMSYEDWAPWGAWASELLEKAAAEEARAAPPAEEAKAAPAAEEKPAEEPKQEAPAEEDRQSVRPGSIVSNIEHRLDELEGAFQGDAEAEPPEEPPVESEWSCGLRQVPFAWFIVMPEQANSGTLVFPMSTA